MAPTVQHTAYTRGALQLLYDWLLESSPTLRRRCGGEGATPSRPVVRLFVRSRPVEGAYDTTVKFFADDAAELPATCIPLVHRKTIAHVMDPPNKGVVYFRVRGPVETGSGMLVWSDCVFDDEISLF